MSGHTPGPWLFRPKSSTVHKGSDTHPYGEQIFEFVDGFEDETMPSEADLKLILAAPDLHDALASALSYIDWVHHGSANGASPVFDKALARAALAKANGGEL